MKFADIIGQENIKAHLKGAILAGKVSHAYIIAGEKGSGKKSIANAFSKTLLCDTGGNDACDNCISCHKSDTGNNPDIINVYKDPEKTVLSVEDIREQLVHTIDIRPYEHKYKIYIVHEAEKMNEAAQNALLKTIEEPPSYAVILLLTENAESFLPTILSRCIRLNIVPLPEETVKAEVMKRENLPDYMAETVAAFSRGNLGKALLLSGSNEFMDKKENVVRIARKLYDMTDGELMDEAKNITEDKENTKDFLSMLQIWYRDVLLYKSVRKREDLIFKGDAPLVEKQADALSYGAINKNLSAIEEAGAYLKANVTPALTVYTMFRSMKDAV